MKGVLDLGIADNGVNALGRLSTSSGLPSQTIMRWSFVLFLI